MQASPRVSAWLLALLLLAFAVGLTVQFRAELIGRTRYPRYSSLQADPSGSKLLFDALTRTGKFQSVTRTFRPLRANSEVGPKAGATILLLGYPAPALDNISGPDLQEWEELARRGNRLLIALDSAGFSVPGKSGRKPDHALRDTWHIRLARASGGPLQWPLFFEDSTGWTTLLANVNHPVIVERAFGAGDIVIASGSNLFANRALADNPDSELLVRLVGDAPRVVFDEAHLGVVDSGSVIGLVRRYNLTGLLCGMILLALAFVWNQAAHFPPFPEAGETAAIAGQDARSGLVQLLRGQIPSARLIATCISEWERSHPKVKIAVPSERDPVKSYLKIQEQLTPVRGLSNKMRDTIKRQA